MNISLIHCYSDKNKGDAAIIIATVQLIKEIDSKASIYMFSTFGATDKRFYEDHKIISPYAKKLLPGCFHEPEVPFGLKNDSFRIFSYIWIFIKSLIILISKNKFFLKLFFREKEIESIYTFLESDLIISKGGSFLYAENSKLRHTLSLIRMLYPFILAKRYRKKTVIFSQSLGPVEGAFNKWLFKNVLVNVDRIYLRESLCLNLYPEVDKICKETKCKIIPDTAFYLQSDSDYTPIKIDRNLTNIGYTLVDHSFEYIDSTVERKEKRKNYIKSIITSIKYLIDKQDSIIHIFPQVQVDISYLGHNDMKISKEIKDYFKDSNYETKIFFYQNNWSPIELRNMYKLMDVFIGTRLHSVIFSLSVFTPSINIAYHGTKSLGILSSINDLKEYVIDINSINETILLEKIEKLMLEKNLIRKKLKCDIANIQEKLINAMKEVIKFGKYQN